MYCNRNLFQVSAIFENLKRSNSDQFWQLYLIEIWTRISAYTLTLRLRYCSFHEISVPVYSIKKKNRRKKYVQDLRLTWVKRGGVIIPNSYSWDYYTSLIVPGYSSNHEVLWGFFFLDMSYPPQNIYKSAHCDWYFSLIDLLPGAIPKRYYCMYLTNLYGSDMVRKVSDYIKLLKNNA
jgi:hypothetical protein